MAELNSIETSREERIYRLNLELKEAKDDLKRTSRMLREEVKRIQAEIDEILNQNPDAPEVVPTSL